MLRVLVRVRKSEPVKRAIAAFALAALLAYDAFRLHRRRVVDMAKFNADYARAAGDAGAP